MESVVATVHFEELASRPLLIARLVLFPLILLFIVLNVAANVVAAPFFAIAFFLQHRRTQALFSLPCLTLHQIGNWGALSLLLSDRWPPDTATVRMSYVPVASGFEIFFRPILALMLAFNTLIFSFPASLALFMQFVHMLMFGRRREGLHGFLFSYWKFLIHACAYLFSGTDERPMLIPSALLPENWYKLLE